MLLKMVKIFTYVMSFFAILERMVTRYKSELGWTNKDGQSMEPLRFQRCKRRKNRPSSITGSDIEFKTAANGSEQIGQIPEDYGLFNILNFISRMHPGSGMLGLCVRGIF